MVRIFSEIDEPLDFNENMSINIVFGVVSRMMLLFSGNCYLRSWYSLKVIYSISNTEETQISMFPIYCMV